jgi:selenocysteine lyase/cysteine desulfurase
MTAAINKLQRMLGLRMPGTCTRVCRTGTERPLVIVTHLEHHSNQITWEECDVDVVIIPRAEETGLPDLAWLEQTLTANESRPLLIGAFSACSNVTGIITPYHEMAALLHRSGGLCFVDFAASAPYVDIDMHPADPARRLDAITFSPHKFLGGPGSSGVLVFSNSLYKTAVPDQPGGGTVKWTTPFGTHQYVDEIELREDGGTPGFLQAIRAALAIKLKEEMGTENIRAREEELKKIFIGELSKEEKVFLLESGNNERLGIISLYATGEHYNLIVKLLNDRYGIQTRGGCSCAGSYGHILFNISQSTSIHITSLIDSCDLSAKPGWVRVSLHPTMTDDEARFVGKAICETIRNYPVWGADYTYHKETGEFSRNGEITSETGLLSRWSGD